MRHRRTRDIVIELTSLLDVVMILIFAVMIQNAQLTEKKVAECEELQISNEEMQGELERMEGISKELAIALAKLDEGNVDELLAELQVTKSQLDAYEYMDDVVVVYNVGLENKYNNTQRCLTYGEATLEGEENLISVSRYAENAEWKNAVNTLKVDLCDFINQEKDENPANKQIYIVFSVDETKVYDQDFSVIDSALGEIESRFEGQNVQYRIKMKERETKDD